MAKHVGLWLVEKLITAVKWIPITRPVRGAQEGLTMKEEAIRLRVEAIVCEGLNQMCEAAERKSQKPTWTR